MEYTIDADDNSNWQIDPKEFANQLTSHWSSVEFEQELDTSDTPNPFILCWKLYINGEMQFGALYEDLRAVSIDDFPPGVAKFSIWYRSIIPEQTRLYLYHDSSDQKIELTTKNTEKEIMEALNKM